MKVAILSMQEVKNYGSFLQAFSLKKTIESLGNTCEFMGHRTKRFFQWSGKMGERF